MSAVCREVDGSPSPRQDTEDYPRIIRRRDDQRDGGLVVADVVAVARGVGDCR